MQTIEAATSTAIGRAQEDTLLLFQSAVRQITSRDARSPHPAHALGAVQLPIACGYSGAEVRRYEVQLEDHCGRYGTVQIVTKEVDLPARRLMALLDTQGHSIVPRCYIPDLVTGGRDIVYQQYVGDVQAPRTREVMRKLATGLASVHALNLGRSDLFHCLPRTDRAYFWDYVVNCCWRPSWDHLREAGALSAFGSLVDRVESSVTRLVDTLETLVEAGTSLSLVHTDICGPHVLLHGAQPFIIDWQQARYGTFYIDLPECFPTEAAAEMYRKALEAAGHTVPPDEFSQGYRCARRLHTLRYLRWTLERWASQPTPAVGQEVLGKFQRILAAPI